MKIHKLKPALITIIVFAIVEICLSGYLAQWRQFYWDSIQKRDLWLWVKYIIQFSIIVLFLVYINGKSQYLITYTSLVYRRRLTQKALKTNYHIIEGGRQRVQEDCKLYPQYILNIGINLCKNLILMFIYLGLVGYQLGIIFISLPIIYALIGTGLAHWISMPLLKLNYDNQQAEAHFRQNLTKKQYGKVNRNNIYLAVATKKLQYFQSFYNQLTVIIPHVMLAPLYFISHLSFGVFMQCASSITNAIESMSYLINQYDSVNSARSCRKRLKELEVIK